VELVDVARPAAQALTAGSERRQRREPPSTTTGGTPLPRRRSDRAWPGRHVIQELLQVSCCEAAMLRPQIPDASEHLRWPGNLDE
jgi:hypothetical protein